MLKPIQVTSRDHRWASSWCWSQYRWDHVITGERVLDVEASTGDVTWSQVSEFMLKPVQVTSRDHRRASSWCWNQYRWDHVITGERVLHVEASTVAITPTVEWTVFQWRWNCLVCRVQRTSLWTILSWSQLSVVNDLNGSHHWHYRYTQFQQQQNYWNRYHLHLFWLHLLITIRLNKRSVNKIAKTL